MCEECKEGVGGRSSKGSEAFPHRTGPRIHKKKYSSPVQPPVTSNVGWLVVGDGDRGAIGSSFRTARPPLVLEKQVQVTDTT